MCSSDLHGRLLHHAGIRRQAAPEHGQAAAIHIGTINGTDDFRIEIKRVGDVFPNRFSRDGFAVEVEMLASPIVERNSKNESRRFTSRKRITQPA